MVSSLSHTKESSLRAHNARLLIGHQLLIRLKRGESNGHLWHDTGGDGSESLVETQWSLALDDLGAGGDEAAGFDLWCVSSCWREVLPVGIGISVVVRNQWWW